MITSLYGFILVCGIIILLCLVFIQEEFEHLHRHKTRSKKLMANMAYFLERIHDDGVERPAVDKMIKDAYTFLEEDDISIS